jgi:hypothetical protein
MITKGRVGVVLLAATLVAGAFTGIANAAAEPAPTPPASSSTLDEPIKGGELKFVPRNPGVPAVPQIPAVPAG